MKLSLITCWGIDVNLNQCIQHDLNWGFGDEDRSLCIVLEVP